MVHAIFVVALSTHLSIKQHISAKFAVWLVAKFASN
jgi:hypothetical protein